MLRNEVNDLDAQAAYEGNDRDEKLDGDMEALGAVDEGLETSDLRMMLSDAVDSAADAKGTDASSILNEAGVLVDDNDDPQVEDLPTEDLHKVLRYLMLEQPDIIDGMGDRYPALMDLLASIAVTDGVGS